VLDRLPTLPSGKVDIIALSRWASVDDPATTGR
jgi:hypothetical protein